jgi:hypothetical protein
MTRGRAADCTESMGRGRVEGDPFFWAFSVPDAQSVS